MKQSYFRVYLLVLAFLIIVLSGYYFESYKTGGPIILLPIGDVVRGMLMLLAGTIVLIDTFLDYRKGFSKRIIFQIDYPMLLGFLFIIGGLIGLYSGFITFISLREAGRVFLSFSGSFWIVVGSFLAVDLIRLYSDPIQLFSIK